MEELKKIINIIVNSPFEVVFVALLIIFMSVILKKIFSIYVSKWCKEIVKSTKNIFDDKLFEALEKPLAFLITMLGIYFALKYISRELYYKEITSVNRKVLKTSWVIFITWVTNNVTTKKSLLYNRVKRKYEGNVYKIVFPFISIIIRIIVVIISISILAREFGFSGFITGLGVSGVVFALAAQETFSNLFGGMVILIDRPFSIGDWVQTPEVEGIIKEITFRSTKITTFSQAIVTVPNAKLANSYITNWTQRNERRIFFRLYLDNRTEAKKIRRIVKKIECFLKSDSRVNKDLIIVTFDEFGRESLNLYIYFYTNVMDFFLYQKTKEDINFKILEILEVEKINLAINRTRVYLSEE
ncbi:MAG: mechanosensitive ion channel family protein [Clostridiaceae bacterium]